MHNSVMHFGQTVLTADVIVGKRVLEVGAYNVNGSLRPHVEQHNPAGYIGTDMRPGPGVDIVCLAENLDLMFAHQPDFDLIICTEMLEHALNWWEALTAIRAVLAPNGRMLLTTRSPGYPLHNDPQDFWRFNYHDLTRDMRNGLGLWVQEPPSRPDHPSTPGILLWAHSNNMPYPHYQPTTPNRVESIYHATN